MPNIVLNELQRCDQTLNAGATPKPPVSGLCKPGRRAISGDRVHCFMSELKQVGCELAQKINRITDIDEELKHALHRLDTQEEEICRYRQQVYKLEADLKARNSKVKDLERKVVDQSSQSQETVKQAKCEAEVAKGRVQQLEECLEEQKRNNCELNQRIESLKSKLRSSEKGAAYYRSLNATLDKTLESKRMVIEDLQQQTQQYLERLVEFEKVKMSHKYLDHFDTSDELQAAKLMLKEKDFEIAQLWENLTVLETAVCENLNEIGVDGRTFKKTPLIVATAKQNLRPSQSEQSRCNACCDCELALAQEEGQLNTGCMSSSGRFVKDGKSGKVSSKKLEEVSRNLQYILKKITQLKQVGGGCGNAQAALTAGQGGDEQCASLPDFNHNCNCGK